MRLVVARLTSRAAMLLRADNAYGLQMSKFWQRVSTWVEAIRKSGHIDACIIIDTQNFNTAMLKSSLFGEISMRGFDGSNLTGVFRISQLPTTILLLFLQGNKTCGLPTPIEWRMEGTVLQNGTNYCQNTPVLQTTRVGDPDTNENESESPIVSDRQR